MKTKKYNFYNLFDKKINFPKYQSPPVFISKNKDVKEYFRNLFHVINYLQEFDIIRRIRGQLNENGNPLFSELNSNGNPNERFF